MEKNLRKIIRKVLQEDLPPQININDVVSLKSDSPDFSIPQGELGTVIHIHPDSVAYDVEFEVDNYNYVETVLKNQVEKIGPPTT